MQKICKVEICDRISKSNGYCNSHRERLRKTGSLSENVPIRERVKRNEVCANKGYIGKRYIDKYGYAFVYVPVENKRSKCMYVSEHRLVMEQKLSRKLLPQETVHYLNGDRQDNRPKIWNYSCIRRNRGKELKT